MNDVLAILEATPEIQDSNDDIIRDQGDMASLNNDAKATKRKHHDVDETEWIGHHHV